MSPTQQWLVPVAAVLLVVGCADPSTTVAPSATPAISLVAGPDAVRAALALRPDAASRSLQAAAPSLALLPSSAELTTFDTRTGLAARTVQLTESFDAFGGQTRMLPTPFTISGVTYTSRANVLINTDMSAMFFNPIAVMCSNDLTPTRGLIGDATTHYSLFGFDLAVLVNVSTVSIALTTNKSSYTFPGVTVEGAATPRFVGFATTDPDEYFTGFTLAGNGRAAVCLGNVTVGSARPLDATAPVIVPTITGTLGADGWYTSAVSLAWAATDAESAVTATTGCDPLTLSANQLETSYTCSATSLGGSASASASIKVDRTVPVVTGAVTSGTMGGNGWYTSNVGVTWTTTAAGPSGQVASGDCARITLTTDSPSYTFACGATTGAGIRSASATVTVKRDASAPVVAWTGNAGSYDLADRVEIACSATDALSGVASSTCAALSGDAWTFGAGPHTVSATATDRAGNTSVPVSVTFTVSVTPAGVCTLLGRWSSKDGITSSLCGKLSRRDYPAFRSELSAQRGKAVSAEHADVLLELVKGM